MLFMFSMIAPSSVSHQLISLMLCARGCYIHTDVMEKSSKKCIALQTIVRNNFKLPSTNPKLFHPGISAFATSFSTLLQCAVMFTFG